MVYCKPQDVIERFYDNVYGTMESVIMAEDFDDGMQINMYDEDGYPKIVVLVDGGVVDVTEIAELGDTEQIVGKLYKDYGFDKDAILEQEPEDPGILDEINEELIEERQCELEDVMIDFLSVVIEKNIVATQAVFGDKVPEIIDHVLEYLYKEHGIDIYRPMILVDENDQEFFEEHPYPCMDFD